MSFPNIWHHRKVAETAAKACDICYRPSSSVLVTPDNKVWDCNCAFAMPSVRMAVGNDIC